jgi:hypothetical protein
MLWTHTSAAGLPRTYLMRGADGPATATTTYATPLLILTTTGSAAPTGIAFLLEWTPRLSAFTFAGSLVDRWGALFVFRLANAVRAAAVALAATVLAILPTGSGSTATALVLGFGTVAGLLAEISHVAVETLVASCGRAGR